MTERRYALVAVEISGIQSYIFASNRLKENVGASYLVAAATGVWALDALRGMNIRTNLTRDDFNNQHIEDGTLDAEVLYSGGGNIVLLFAEAAEIVEEIRQNDLPPQASSRQFIRTLSRRVQQDAPGLQLTFSAAPFAWSEPLSVAVSNLLEDMKQQRSYQPPLRGDAGLSVQIMGTSTSLPAVTMDGDPDGNWQPISAETAAKRTASDDANKLLRRSLDIGDTNYRFALEMDDLGRSEDDTSYIAVVHADGNGLGAFIQGLKADYGADRNRDYIMYMRDFSQNVKKVAQAAQRDMVARLRDSIDEKDGRTVLGLGRKVTELKLSNRGNEVIFPIRPLVSGGDDVTFVCDGRIGLDLAVIFLEAFEKHARAILATPLTACAGVAIVKTHYPFARAYDLAEELAGNAKQARYDVDPETGPSAVDWHITAGGLYGDLEEMRNREYEVADGHLTLRPIFVSEPDDANGIAVKQTWRTFQSILTHFQTQWGSHQNKAEGLRAILRKGSAETQLYKMRYLSDSDSPDLPNVAGFADSGWHDGYCGYYDALELMDKYIPLTTEGETN
jgi:hypothetical protein